MREPTTRVLPTCPCCGQFIRRGWRRQPRWGQFMEYAGRGKITPRDDVPLIAPPDFVRQVASAAAWAEPPEQIAASVFGTAEVLARAGWTR